MPRRAAVASTLAHTANSNRSQTILYTPISIHHPKVKPIAPPPPPPSPHYRAAHQLNCRSLHPNRHNHHHFLLLQSLPPSPPPNTHSLALYIFVDRLIFECVVRLLTILYWCSHSQFIYYHYLKSPHLFVFFFRCFKRNCIAYLIYSRFLSLSCCVYVSVLIALSTQK